MKEFINQPHKYKRDKNLLLLDIDNAFKEASYLGFSIYKGRKSHIFEITVNQEKSWLIANEYKGRGVILYSITASEKILTYIEKT
ncbi:hypothetical protein GO491_04095 [Flavobacteriaceae bacterium Ap0902]|nr:hypothetical protein [Flavobacteriaceae bacterium Ap0902]